MPHPIFYDPQRKRWKRVRRVLNLAGMLLTLVIAFFAVSVLRTEPLPSLHMPQELRAVSDDGKSMFDVLRDGKAVPFDERVMQFLKSEKFPMEVFPLVNNFDPIANDWIPAIGDMLRDPAARAAFRRQVDTFLASD